MSVSAIPIGKMSDERKKLLLAATFDRLVDSNLALSIAVSKLVKTTYLILGFNTVVLATVLWFLSKR